MLLLASLLVRQVETFQAFLILIGKGLIPQSAILLRNMAESMFIVGAIGKDQTFAESYIQSEDLPRLKVLRKLRETSLRRGNAPDPELDTSIGELEKKTGKGKIWQTIEIAKVAELTDYYDTLYRFMSMTVHTSPRSLNEILVVGSNGDVEALNYAPKVENLEVHLACAIDMMSYTLHEIATHFSLDPARIGLEEVHQRLRTLDIPFAMEKHGHKPHRQG